MKRRGFRLRRETSAQSAERFLQLVRNRRKRHHGRRLMCCARYVFGDGTHDLSCGNCKCTLCGASDHKASDAVCTRDDS